MHILSICTFDRSLLTRSHPTAWMAKHGLLRAEHFYGHKLSVVDLTRQLFAKFYGYTLLLRVISLPFHWRMWTPYSVVVLCGNHLLVIVISCWWVEMTFRLCLESWMKTCVKVSLERTGILPLVEVQCQCFSTVLIFRHHFKKIAKKNFYFPYFEHFMQLNFIWS